MKKLISIFTGFALAFCANLSAETQGLRTSGLRAGTASTIEDDVYDLMNVNTWQRLEFEKVFGFTSINSNSSANVAAAIHVQEKNVLGFGWDGNLWNDDSDSTSYNNFTGFYGWDNSGLRVTLSESTSEKAGTDEETEIAFKSTKIFTGKATFGMNVSEQLAFWVYAGLSNQKQEGVESDTSIKITSFALEGGLLFTLKNEENLLIKSFVDLSFIHGKEKVEMKIEGYKVSGDFSVNTFSVTPGIKLQYKPTDTFTYGLHASMPIEFQGGDVASSKEVDFNIRNGFSAALTEKVLLNGGISTWLPSIYIPENGDTYTDDFVNVFYAGFAIYITPAFRLDTYASIEPADGVSLDEIWKENFSISLSARL